MKRFIEGVDRSQSTLFPERLEDFIAEDNPVRVVDVFVEQLDLRELGFKSIDPCATGRPAYHPSDTAEALHLWLSQSYSIESSSGAGDAAQR